MRLKSDKIFLKKNNNELEDKTIENIPNKTQIQKKKMNRAYVSCERNSSNVYI